LFASGIFDPSISVLASDNLEGRQFHILLGVRVIEATTNKTLSGVECVSGVSDGLQTNPIRSKFIKNAEGELRE
jgi:hypothetical protein